MAADVIPLHIEAKQRVEHLSLVLMVHFKDTTTSMSMTNFLPLRSELKKESNCHVTRAVMQSAILSSSKA